MELSILSLVILFSNSFSTLLITSFNKNLNEGLFLIFISLLDSLSSTSSLQYNLE